MMKEHRDYNAEYYDAFTKQVADIEFYSNFLNNNTDVLELGCGTGRVSLALSEEAKSFVGIDISKAMIAEARKKCAKSNVEFILGDITNLSLKRKFDFVIAPL